MNNRLILSLSLLLCAMTGFAQRSIMTANTTGYGQLQEIIGDKAHDIDSLIVAGPIDATDFITIWDCALYGKLQGLNLADAQVEDNKIPNYAFFDAEEQVSGTGSIYYLDLRYITLPEGITEIGDYAFDRVAMEQITLPKSLRKLGQGAFYHCSWLQGDPLVIPEGVKEIPAKCFYHCENIKKLVLPSTLKTIGEFAFAENRMTECNFPDGLEAIKQSAFEGSEELREVILPNSCLTIEPFAFGSCRQMECFRFPEDITYIPSNVLRYNESLKHVEIPSKVTEIRQSAFLECPLDSIVLPSTLKLLEEDCLSGSIRAITSLATTPPECTGKAGTSKKGPFLLSSSNVPIYVPKGSIDAYKNAWGWDIFQTFHELDDVPTAIKAPNSAMSLKVSGGNGGIHLTASESRMDYKVYASDGRLFKSGTATGEASISCPNGLYIVSVGDNAYKVIVR